MQPAYGSCSASFYILNLIRFAFKGIESVGMKGLDLCLSKFAKASNFETENALSRKVEVNENFKMHLKGLYINSSPALLCCAWQVSCLTAAIV